MSDDEPTRTGGKLQPPQSTDKELSHIMDKPVWDNTALDALVQAHIGRELRSLFDEIVHEPVPDRFLQLLQTLEAKKGDSA